MSEVLTEDETYRVWVDRFEQHLKGVPILLDHMRSNALFSALGATPTDSPRVGGSRDKSPLPWKGDGIDDADDLWSVLVLYAQEVAELTGGSSPQLLREQHTRQGEVAGFRANADPLTARAQARIVVDWLTDRADLILEHPQLDDSEKHLLALIRAGRGKYGFGAVRLTGKRWCGVCGACEVLLHWVTATDGGSEPRGRCRICGDRT